jgi:dTDP-4-amino-4,6-dideoxygalactose transaminase
VATPGSGFASCGIITTFTAVYGSVATAAFRAEVSLPIYPSMTDDDVRDVIDAVRDVVASNRA